MISEQLAAYASVEEQKENKNDFLNLFGILLNCTKESVNRIEAIKEKGKEYALVKYVCGDVKKICIDGLTYTKILKAILNEISW